MKRLISITLMVMILLGSFTTTTMATEEVPYDEIADELSTIGVFVGTGNGYELDREATRLEGLIMLIRLLGKEDEALSSSETDDLYFTDVPAWGVKYTNYAYENGLTAGIAEGEFGSSLKIDAKSYYTFLLRALGYDDKNGDFSWSSAVEDALSMGLIDSDFFSEVSSGVFLRKHVAKGSYDALNASLKNGTQTLLDKLTSTKDVAWDAAEKIKDSFSILLGLNDDDNTTDTQDNRPHFEGYTWVEPIEGSLSGYREPNAVVDIGFDSEYATRHYYALTNQWGQLIRIVADEIILQNDDLEPVNEDGRFYDDEAKVPGTESPNLDEGHVIADSMGGKNNAYNITPQNSALNRYGDQAYMESVIRSAGGCTDFEAIITYPNTSTQIPSHYKFTYTINGNVIVDEFDNVDPNSVPVVEEPTTDTSANSNIKITSVDKRGEHVIIENTGDEAVNLAGWKLVSEKGNQSMTFPSFTLNPGQSIKITSGAEAGTGDFTSSYATIWNNSSPDPAVLYDASGNEVDRY